MAEKKKVVELHIDPPSPESVAMDIVLNEYGHFCIPGKAEKRDGKYYVPLYASAPVKRWKEVVQSVDFGKVGEIEIDELCHPISYPDLDALTEAMAEKLKKVKCDEISHTCGTCKHCNTLLHCFSCVHHDEKFIKIDCAWKRYIDPRFKEEVGETGVDKLKKGFHFSATVVDEETGCVFGLSATEDRIVLVPKHKSTFESYLRFLREVCRLIDENAELTLTGEERP